MKIFVRFLFLLIFIFICDVFRLLLGYVFYRLGRFFSNQFFVKVGHRLIAHGSAPYFGLNSKWIAENCPYSDSNCSKCRLWTCSKYCCK